MFRQLIRFGGIGGMATLVHVVVAMVMHESFGTSPLNANFAGFASALLLSYVGHAHLTFGTSINEGSQFIRFVFVGLIALGSSSSLVWILNSTLGVNFGFAMVAVAVLVPVLSFFALRFWVFAATSPQSDVDWIGLGLSGALALATLAIFWGRMINHDTAWYLIATREWLAGADLYTYIIEVNPPLNFYFTLPAIWLADLLGISDTNGEYLAVTLLLFVILVWCRALAFQALDLSPKRNALLLCGIALALVLPALRDFGQREHVMVMLIMPWLIGELITTPTSKRGQILRAAVAALGICLKPHFVVFPLAVTLLSLGRQRSLRPVFSIANMTMLTVGLAYVSFVVLFHPAYFTKIVPIAREVYGAYGTTFGVVFSRVELEILLLLPAVFLVIKCHYRTEACLFAVVALAGLASYFLQGTGFGYHAIPFRAFVILACCFVVLKNPLFTPGAIFALIAAALLMSNSIARGFYKNTAVQQIAHVAKELGTVDSLFVMTSHVSAGPSAAIASGSRWTSRYPANWLIPGALNRLDNTNCESETETCARLQAIAASNRADNISDIASSRPDLLVFDRRSGYFDTPHFSWETFMNEDPAWADVFNEYTKLGESHRFSYYVHSGNRMTKNLTIRYRSVFQH